MTIHCTPNVVSSAVVLVLHAPDGQYEIRAVLTWRRDDPVAMTMRFIDQPGQPDWVFARSLLADGLIRWTGALDIRIGPAFATPESPRHRTGICLNSPSGSADLTADTEALTEFICASFARVPEGYEFAGVDIDSELAQLLEGEAA
jgi:hypothetical protein